MRQYGRRCIVYFHKSSIIKIGIIYFNILLHWCYNEFKLIENYLLAYIIFTNECKITLAYQKVKYQLSKYFWKNV